MSKKQNNLIALLKRKNQRNGMTRNQWRKSKKISKGLWNK